MFVDYLKERSLIATFLSTEMYDHLIDSLDENDFYSEDNQKYIKAIKTVRNGGNRPGLLRVREELLKNKVSKEVVSSFENVFSQAYSNSSEAEFNYKKIKELSQKRALNVFYLKQSDSLSSPSVTPQDSCLETEQFLEKIYQMTDSDGQVYDSCNDIFGDPTDFIPTGIQHLDNIIIGLERTDMVILAAGTSQGKTTLAQNILQNNLHEKNLFFSLEMNYKQIKQRILSNETKISRDNIVRGNLTETQKAIVRQTNLELKDKYKNLIIYDKIKSISDIEVECKKQKLKNGKLGIVLIDYLQLVKTEGISERRLQVENITGRVKDLASVIESPVLLLSQFSRIKEGDKPTLNHLKESGSIENDADVVLFIWNDNGVVWIIIAKNRQGKRGKVRVDRNFNYYQFQDYDEEIKERVSLL